MSVLVSLLLLFAFYSIYRTNKAVEEVLEKAKRDLVSKFRVRE